VRILLSALCSSCSSCGWCCCGCCWLGRRFMLCPLVCPSPCRHPTACQHQHQAR
jgi:hypothetical protein